MSRYILTEILDFLRSVGGRGEGLFEILAGWVARPGWLGTPPPTVKYMPGDRWKNDSWLVEMC